MRQRIMRTTAPAVVILVRCMVGAVFLSEGIQKFLFPESRTDWSMTLGSLFLLIAGAGPWSLDAWLASLR